MKTTFQTKFLQLLNQKKREKGFTLIELLVVIIIIGILSAVALPTFLNQAGRARRAGAESILGAINRSQQAYRVEETQFADNVTELELGYTEAPTPDGYNQLDLNGGDVATTVANTTSTDDQNSLCGVATIDTTAIQDLGANDGQASGDCTTDI